jgi:hypothetical protein
MNTKPTPIARAALAIAALCLATYAPLSPGRAYRH